MMLDPEAAPQMSCRWVIWSAVQPSCICMSATGEYELDCNAEGNGDAAVLLRIEKHVAALSDACSRAGVRFICKVQIEMPSCQSRVYSGAHPERRDGHQASQMLEPQLPQGFLVDLPSCQEHHGHLHRTNVCNVVILQTPVLVN
jgi:hypothetical protein